VTKNEPSASVNPVTQPGASLGLIGEILKVEYCFLFNWLVSIIFLLGKSVILYFLSFEVEKVLFICDRVVSLHCLRPFIFKLCFMSIFYFNNKPSEKVYPILWYILYSVSSCASALALIHIIILKSPVPLFTAAFYPFIQLALCLPSSTFLSLSGFIYLPFGQDHKYIFLI
jgi:hypothetical protein